MGFALAGNDHFGAVCHERVRDRESYAARAARDDSHFPVERLHGYYNSARMRDVAIIGAGELGGLLAHALARRSIARSIHLVDETGRVAEGKALDITQAAPIEGFATSVYGSADTSAAAGADVIVLADRVGGTEWQGDDALVLLKRMGRTAGQAVIVCAGAGQRDIIERGVRELHIPRTRLIGSAPEALVSAARAMVALEIDTSPRDIALAVLGVPPKQTVIVWEDATVSGLALTRTLSEPVRARLTARICALWPVGPYALASAAVRSIEGLLGRSRGSTTCFVAPDDSAGTRTRTAALPVRLGPSGVVEVVLPSLSAAERVALDNAMLL
jgi:malate dehydrogenase